MLWACAASARRIVAAVKQAPVAIVTASWVAAASVRGATAAVRRVSAARSPRVPAA